MWNRDELLRGLVLAPRAERARADRAISKCERGLGLSLKETRTNRHMFHSKRNYVGVSPKETQTNRKMFHSEGNEDWALEERVFMK